MYATDCTVITMQLNTTYTLRAVLPLIKSHFKLKAPKLLSRLNHHRPMSSFSGFPSTSLTPDEAGVKKGIFNDLQALRTR